MTGGVVDFRWQFLPFRDARYSARMRKSIRSEHSEQVAFVARVRHFYPQIVIFAIPNGGQRSITEASRLKAEGVLAGIPDLFIAKPVGNYSGLFVEMKRTKKSSLSATQKTRINALTTAGYKTHVAYGCDDAWAAFEEYIAQKSTVTM